jgi:hypothetical protein
VLADLVHTDRHNHRPMAADSDLAEPTNAAATNTRLQPLAAPDELAA